MAWNFIAAALLGKSIYDQRQQAKDLKRQEEEDRRKADKLRKDEQQEKMNTKTSEFEKARKGVRASGAGRRGRVSTVLSNREKLG